MKKSTNSPTPDAALGVLGSQPVKKDGTPYKFRLDLFIIRKYVKEENISFARDVKIAQKLIKKYPELAFWEWLPVNFMVKSMVQILTPKAKNRLKYLYEDYIKTMERNKKIVVIEKPQIPIYNVDYSDYKLPEDATPKNILEFLK